MENDNIDKGVDMASEPAVAYGRVGSRRETPSSTIRKISRAQLEKETITLEELDCRLTSFIDRHFEIAK